MRRFGQFMNSFEHSMNLPNRPRATIPNPPTFQFMSHLLDHMILGLPGLHKYLGKHVASSFSAKSFGDFSNTPLKINMEHNNEGLVQMIFLSNWVIFMFQPLTFRGLVDLIVGLTPWWFLLWGELRKLDKFQFHTCGVYQWM